MPNPTKTYVYELKNSGFLENSSLPDIQDQVDKLLEGENQELNQANERNVLEDSQAESITLIAKAQRTNSIQTAADSAEQEIQNKRRIYLDFRGNSITNLELKELLEEGYREGLNLTDSSVLREFLLANAPQSLLKQLAVVSADSTMELVRLPVQSEMATRSVKKVLSKVGRIFKRTKKN